MLKDLVKSYLEEEPLFRERKNKDRGIVHLLIDRYGLNLTESRLIALVQDYASMDRMWRQILQQNPELRGSDFKDKEKLEQEKQAELGYKTTTDYGKPNLGNWTPKLL